MSVPAPPTPDLRWLPAASTTDRRIARQVGYVSGEAIGSAECPDARCGANLKSTETQVSTLSENDVQ